jgi:hypothetical protein
MKQSRARYGLRSIQPKLAEENPFGHLRQLLAAQRLVESRRVRVRCRVDNQQHYSRPEHFRTRFSPVVDPQSLAQTHDASAHTGSECLRAQSIDRPREWSPS